MHILEQNKQFKRDINYISFSGRTWPRAIHNKYLGAGQFDTGFVPVPSYVAEQLVLEGLGNERTNSRKFREIGLNKSTSEDYAKSGLLAVTASDIRRETKLKDINSIGSLGGIPFDEYNSLNLPNVEMNSKMSDVNDKYKEKEMFISL